MKNRDLTFLIKVQNVAKAALKAFTDDLRGVGNAAQAVNKTDVDKKFNDIRKAADDAAKSLRATAQQTTATMASEASAQERISQMVDRTIARQAQARASASAAGNSGPREAGSRSGAAAATAIMSQTVVPTAAKDLAELEKESNNLAQRADRLLASINPLYAAQAKWNSKIKEATDLEKAGAISTKELNDVHKAAKVALEGAEKGATKLGGAMHGSSGAIREMIVVGRELGRGDFTRLPGSLTILAQQFKLLGFLTPGVLLGMAGIGVAVAAMAAAFLKGSQESAALDNTLRITNNTAGLTASTFHELAQRVATDTHSTLSASIEITDAFVKTGKFSKEALVDLTESTIQFARLTGQSADDVVKEWQKIGDDPVKFANQLAEQYDLVTSAGKGLTASNIELARELLNSGDKMAAVNLIAKSVHDGLVDQQENVGLLTRLWRGLSGAIDDAWQSMLNWGKADKDGLANLEDARNHISEQIKNYNDFSGVLAKFGIQRGPNTTQQAALAAVDKEIAGIKQRTQAEADAAQARSRLQAGERDANNARVNDYTRLIDRTADYNNALKQLETRRNNAFNYARKNPGDKVAQDTANFYRTQDANIRAELRKQYLPATEKAEKAGESAAAKAAREAAAAQKQFESQLKSLEQAYVPVIARQEQYNNNLALLNKAHAQGKLSEDAYQAALGNLKEGIGEESDSIGKTVEKLRQEATVRQASVGSREALTQIMQLEDQMRKDGLAYMKDGVLVIAATANATAEETRARYENAKAMIAQSVADKALQASKDQNQAQSDQNAVDRQAALLPANLANAYQIYHNKVNELKRKGVVDAADLDKQATDAVRNAHDAALNSADAALRDFRSEQETIIRGMGLYGYAAERYQRIEAERARLTQQGTLSQEEINLKAEQYGKILDDVHNKQLQTQGSFSQGLKEGYALWVDNAKNIAANTAQFVGNTIDGLSNLFTTFATTGKFAFKDFVRSALADLTQLVTKILLVKALQAAAPGLGIPLFHNGGMAGGAASGYRPISPTAFDNARRLHSGGMGGGYALQHLRSRERAVIVLDDERVLNPEETRAYNAGQASVVGNTARASTSGGSGTGGGSPIVIAPNFNNTFHNNGGGGQGGNGLSPEQADSASKALEAEMNKHLDKWVQKEMRPGGRLNPGNRR